MEDEDDETGEGDGRDDEEEGKRDIFKLLLLLLLLVALLFRAEVGEASDEGRSGVVDEGCWGGERNGCCCC